MADIDVLCIARAATNDELHLMELAKAARVPVWVDYDDNLLDLPEANPAYVEYIQPSIRQNILTAVAEADLVTASTDYLAGVLQPARKAGSRPVAVVRNGLHPNWPKRAVEHNRSAAFLWRGSSSHLSDVIEYGLPIAQGLPESAAFQIMGWFAWPLANAVLGKIQNLSYTKELPINLYFRELESSGAVAGVVPLCDNAFNRSKSNIAQLESLAAGALAIVPDWPEWQLPGSLRYTDRDSMCEAVAKVLEIPYNERKDMWEAGIAAALKQSFDAYEQRYQILASLLTVGVPPMGPPSGPPAPPRLRLAAPTYGEVAATTLN
jgi:hypothetical protein